MQFESERPASTLRIVARDVGALQVLISLAMAASLLVSLLYGEVYTALAFLAGAALTASLGLACYRRCHAADEPKRRHAMLIAASGWLVSAGLGSLPFLFAAWWTPPEVARGFVPPGESYASSLYHFRSPLHAFFESMSAYTTTGLTMAVHEPSIGHGLLFYRSLAQWIGGVGVIVLSLAIIPRPSVVGEIELYQSETAGMKLRPSIVGTARAIWKIYLGLTILVALYLFVATRVLLPDYGVAASLFDAVNHAMTGLATGGFSTLDDSIATYRSYAMELAHIPPMVLGAVSIPLYYVFLRQRTLRVFWREAQFRTMIWLFAVLIPAVCLLLAGSSAVADPIREGIFQVVSACSGTGWQTSNIHGWGASATLLVAWIGVVAGGAAGSTAGGIKLIRVYLLFRSIGWRVRRVFLPGSAMVPFQVDDRSLSTAAMQREVSDATVFTLLYLLVLAVGTIFAAHAVGPGFTLADAIFEASSAQGTTGLSTGLTDPGMPLSIEIVFIVQMWVGRLEIFPVIILLRTLLLWSVRR